MARDGSVETTSDSASDRGAVKRDRGPLLFRPISFRSVTARNRIMLSPMCQYSATDGVANDWHLVHLGARASGGAGIVFTEVVHSEARGRITPNCLGLWNDGQRDALARIVDFIVARGAVPAMQVGHAGRKGSAALPWEGGKSLALSNGGWATVSASSVPFADGWPAPTPLDAAGIREQLDLLAASTRRAREAGFQIIELHGAHGYLINQFLSPLSNRREDDYGGSFDNRIRFLLEAIEAVRSEWPAELPLFLRISAKDWIEGGWDLDDSIRLANVLKERGEVDLIDCSSGGSHPGQQIPIFPGYQGHLSRAIREASGIQTAAVGLITTPDMAENVLASGAADIVAMARALLADPVWPLRAAKTLKADVEGLWPVRYERGNIF